MKFVCQIRRAKHRRCTAGTEAKHAGTGEHRQLKLCSLCLTVLPALPQQQCDNESPKHVHFEEPEEERETHMDLNK